MEEMKEFLGDELGFWREIDINWKMRKSCVMRLRNHL